MFSLQLYFIMIITNKKHDKGDIHGKSNELAL